MAANPEKNNKAIAEMIGVGEETIRRARKVVPPKEGTATRRQGKDGKSYPATKLKSNKQRLPIEQEYLARVEQAQALAKVPYKGKITDEVIELARGVVKAWNELADEFEKQRGALN